MSGLNLGDALINRPGCRDAPPLQQVGYRIAIDVGGETVYRMKSLELRAEHQSPAGSTVVQRLLAEAVSGQPKFMRVPIPYRQSKHSDHSFQCWNNTYRRDRLKKHLGVRMTD